MTHQKEICKTTNTARLVSLILSNAEVRVRGRLGAPVALDDLVDAPGRCWLLYPSDGARELDEEILNEGSGPLTLIVPDGNWSQARKLAKRERVLDDVPRVILPAGPLSRYRLRRHVDPRRLATLEAIARALGLLEGPNVQRAIERVFDCFVERTLFMRGEIRAQDVRSGLGPDF